MRMLTWVFTWWTWICCRTFYEIKSFSSWPICKVIIWLRIKWIIGDRKFPHIFTNTRVCVFELRENVKECVNIFNLKVDYCIECACKYVSEINVNFSTFNTFSLKREDICLFEVASRRTSRTCECVVCKCLVVLKPKTVLVMVIYCSTVYSWNGNYISFAQRHISERAFWFGHMFIFRFAREISAEMIQTRRN